MPVSPRGIDYLDWAFSVPGTAHYDLSQSGVTDAVDCVDEVASAAASFEAAPALDRRNTRPILDAYRNAVAGRYGLDRSHVVPALGTSGAIAQALLALARPGDAVIVERPAYEPLWGIPRKLGMSVTPLERTLADDWSVVPDRLPRLLTSRTKLLVLSNLHNPTGAALDAATLAEVAELAERVGATVLVDEVYLDFVPGALRPEDGEAADDGRPAVRSGVHVAPNVVVLGSMTKAMGLGALRAGWIACRDPSRIAALERAAQFLHVLPPLPAVALATRLLARADLLVERARRTSSEGLRVLRRFLAAQDRLRAVVPEHGLCAALALPAPVQADELVRHMHRRYDTLAVPGTFFDAPDLVRVGVGIDPRILEQGLANLLAAVEDLLP